MSLKLPEPITISKKLTQELDELERKGETIVSICGYSNIEALFYLYLIKKYKSKCVTKKIGKLEREDTLLGMSINIKFKLTKEEEAKMREEFVILAKTLTQCIKKGENTIIIPLNYYKGFQPIGHSNMLIYRRRTNVIEHFEPHGGLFKGDEKEQLNIENKINFFIRIFNVELKKNNIPDVSYVEATNVCPYLRGLQTLENSSLLKKSKGEPGGYCSIWSMFFAELCLKNPDKSSEEILENIYIYLTTKASAENYLKKVIRGYSGYVVESVNTYLKIFFKPTYTVADIIGFQKNFNFTKVYKMRNAIRLLIELESEILLDDNYDLEADLKSVKKVYNKAIKGMTIEEQIEARHKDKVVQPLYYKKRILQNYEEYSNNGKILEAIADSPLELMEDTMTDHPILNKRQKTQKAIAPMPKPKTRTRRLSPNTKEDKEHAKQSRKAINDLIRQKREEEKDKEFQEKLLARLIKGNKIDMKTKKGQDELLKMLLDLQEK
jgi:hypothetical protein